MSAAAMVKRIARKSMGSIRSTASLMMKNVEPQITVIVSTASVARPERRILASLRCKRLH